MKYQISFKIPDKFKISTGKYGYESLVVYAFGPDHYRRVLVEICDLEFESYFRP